MNQPLVFIQIIMAIRIYNRYKMVVIGEVRGERDICQSFIFWPISQNSASIDLEMFLILPSLMFLWCCSYKKRLYRRFIPSLYSFDIIELIFWCVELVRAFSGHIIYSYPLDEFCTFYNILQATSYQWPVNEHSVEERFQGSVLQSDPKLISLYYVLCILYEFNLISRSNFYMNFFLRRIPL